MDCPNPGRHLRSGFQLGDLAAPFSIGPALDDLYRTTINGSALAANVALLDALTQALEANQHASDRFPTDARDGDG